MNKGKIFKFIKRFFVVLLCAVLLFVCVISSSSYKVKAAVPVVAVGIAALASFLSAAGVSLATQNLTKDSFSDSLYDIANQYSTEQHAPTLEETIASQNALNYYYNNKAGEAIVSMSDTVASWFNGFKNWFVNNFSLTDSGETVLISSSVVSLVSGDYPYYETVNGSMPELTNGKVPVSAVPVVPGSVQVIQVTNDLYVNLTFSEDYYAYNQHLMDASFTAFDSNNTVVANANFPYLRPDSLGSYDRFRVVFTNLNGNLALCLVPSDQGDYSFIFRNLTLPLAFSSVDLSHFGLSGSLSDGYSDFEQALSDARTDAGVNGQIAVGVGDVAVEKPYTQEGVVDGILDNVISNVGTGTLVGGYADEKEVEEETDSEKVPTVAEIGEGIVIVDGLEDFFPFCIPFDLIALIDRFNVEPEAPVIHWNMSFAGLFSDEELVLDFSGWETAALIFRICCLIGFSLFLILKTRDMIRG